MVGFFDKAFLYLVNLHICNKVQKEFKGWIRIETVRYKEWFQVRLWPNPNYFGQTWTKMKYQRNYNNVSIQCNYAILIVCTTGYLRWQKCHALYEKKNILIQPPLFQWYLTTTHIIKYPPRMLFTLHLLSYAVHNTALMKYVINKPGI